MQNFFRRLDSQLRTFEPIAIAQLYCARYLFSSASSFSSARTKSKTQQNIELMNFALTWCAYIFVGCSVNPTFFSFFRQITSFSDSFHYTKKEKNLCVGSFNYFSYTIQKGLNWYMDRGLPHRAIFVRP